MLSDTEKIWLKKSSSGNGVVIELEEKVFYVTSVKQLERCLRGEIKACPFSKIVEDKNENKSE